MPVTATTVLHEPTPSSVSDPLENIDVQRQIAARTHQPFDPTFGSDLTVAPPEVASAQSTSQRWATQWWRARLLPEGMEAISGFQKWEGRVVEVDSDFFTAELTPLDTHGEARALYGDFESRLLQPDHLEVGDVVYITARMVEQGRGVPPAKTLSVRLRRVGNWTADELSKVTVDAARSWEALRDLVE